METPALTLAEFRVMETLCEPVAGASRYHISVRTVVEALTSDRSLVKETLL